MIKNALYMLIVTFLVIPCMVHAQTQAEADAVREPISIKSFISNTYSALSANAKQDADDALNAALYAENEMYDRYLILGGWQSPFFTAIWVVANAEVDAKVAEADDWYWNSAYLYMENGDIASSDAWVAALNSDHYYNLANYAAAYDQAVLSCDLYDNAVYWYDEAEKKYSIAEALYYAAVNIADGYF